jgi:hypothetical protein
MKRHHSTNQACVVPAILMTDCVLNLSGWNMYNSSEMLRSVIVDVFTIGWSMPSMSTQFPAGTRLTSTLYLKHIPKTHQLELNLYQSASVWLTVKCRHDAVSTVFCTVSNEMGKQSWMTSVEEFGGGTLSSILGYCPHIHWRKSGKAKKSLDQDRQ